MAFNILIGLYVNTPATTANTISGPAWSNMQPTYWTYPGNTTNRSFGGTGFTLIDTLFTDASRGPNKYVLYLVDVDASGFNIDKYGQIWFHNDTSAYAHPDSPDTNVNNGKYVWVYDQEAPPSYNYNGTTLPVFTYDCRFNMWQQSPNTSWDREFRSKFTAPVITLDYPDNGTGYGWFDGPEYRYGTSIVELYDTAPASNTKLLVTADGTSLTTSSNGTYNQYYIYDCVSSSYTNQNSPAQTSVTYPRRVYAIHDGAGTSPRYHVGYIGNNSAVTVYHKNTSRITNEWVSLRSAYNSNYLYLATTVSSLSQFIEYVLPVQLGRQYDFTVRTRGAATYNGIIVSKTQITNPSGTATLANIGTSSDRIAYASGTTTVSDAIYKPTADGNVYVYCRTRSSGTIGASNSTGCVMGSVVIYDTALDFINVTFNKNGGSGGTNSQLILPGTAAGNYPSITLPTRSGYIFLGYYDSSTGGTAYYNAAGQGVRIFDKVENCTLYAHWQQESLPTITVTLNKNGGSGGQDTVSVVSGQMVGTVTIPSRTGFTFLGYYSSVSSNASGNKYIDNSGTGCKAISSAMTLYALWENTISYDLLYSVQNPKVVTYSTSSQLITVSDGGWVCAGGTISNVQYSFNGSVSSSDGGMSFTIPSNNVATYTLSVTLTSPTSSVANGYFGTTKTYSFDVRYIQKNIEFYLLGQEVYSPNTAQAKVRAEVAGTLYWGTSSSSMTSTQSITAGLSSWTNITSATQTSVGTKTIYGYFVPSSNNYNWVGGIDNPGGSAVLKVLAAAQTVTITLNDNGGSGGSGSIVVQTGSTCSTWPSVSVPTRAGFTFMGYYTVSTATGGSRVYYESGSPYYGYSTSSNVTIYARWKINISYTHNNISAESASEEFVSNQPGEATSTSSTVTFQINGGQINCVVSSWTISITDSNKASWTINSTGTSFTVPSGVSYTYSPTYFRWQIVVADGTYNNYPYVGNTLQSGYTWETDTPRPIYYNLKKVEYVKDSNNTIIKYKAINGAEGFNLTSTGTPNIGTTYSSPYYYAYEYDSYVYSYTLTNERNWYQKYTNGTWDSSLKTGTYSVYPKWRIISETFTRASDGQVSNIERTHVGDNAVSSQLLIDGVYRTVYDTSTNEGDFVHESMGENLGTDTIVFRLYNPDDTSKYQEVTKSVTNSLGTQHYADTNGTTGEASVTANNPTVSIGSGMTAGSTTYGTVTCVCNDTITYYLKYTSNAYTPLQTGTQTATAYWLISSQTYTPDGGTASTTTRFDYRYSTGTATININGVNTTVRKTGNDIKHTTMAANIGTDSVTVTAYRGDDTTKTATATCNISNLPIWGNVTLTVSSPATPYTAAAAGETKTITASATQARTLPSGSSASAVTLDESAITCSVKTSQTWASLNASEKKVTINNNTSTSARSGFVVTVTATGNGGKSASSDRTFNQSAGAMVYGTPTISTYTFSYSNAAAAGATVTPSASCTGYSQTWTWNGVSGSGGTLTSGQTVTVDSYTTSGTFPSGCSTNSDYSSTGKVVWTNNTSTSVKDATSNVKVKFKINGKASSAKDCTSCKQNAGSMVWEDPELEAWTYPLFDKAGETNTPAGNSWSQQYTWNGVSGSGSAIGDWDYSGYTVTWTYTKGTLPSGCTAGSDFATTGSITWGNNTTTSERDAASVLSATIKVNGKTSNSCTCYACKQAAGEKVYANPTVTGYSYANFAANGSEQNKIPTVTYTQAYTWNGVPGSGGTDSYTYDSSHTNPGGSRAFTAGTLPSGFSKGTNFATTGAATWGNNTSTSTRDAKSILSVTVTVNSKTSSSFPCSSCLQNAGAKVYANPTVTGYSYATFSAAGASSRYPTVTYTQVWTWNEVSGSGSTDSYTYDSSHTSPGGTRAFTAGTLTSGFTKGTSFATSGRITAASRGTTIGNARNCTSALSVVVTVNSKSSASFTCTACIQNGNYVTTVAPSGSTGYDTHISYANIGPGATSATVTKHGAATYTFSSGGTLYDSSTSPSFGGTATYNRTYSLSPVQNGFSAVNSSGTLTVTSKGTTVGGPWVSGNITSTLTVTYTHASSYSAGGTKSGTMTSTVTCTQTANEVESISLVLNPGSVNYGTPSYATVTATYTSGSTKDVSNDSGTTYSETGINAYKIPSDADATYIVVDDFPEGVAEFVASYGGYDHFYDEWPQDADDPNVYYYSDTFTYNGSTKYIWYCEDNGLYVMTNTKNAMELMSKSVFFNLNNFFEEPIIVRLNEDREVYEDGSDYKILRVYV